MTAPSGSAVLVVGRGGAADAGEVMGTFEILDMQLHVVAAGALVNARQVAVESLTAGRYFARASLLSSRRTSTPFEVSIDSPGPVVVDIDDAGTGDEPIRPSGDGWLAGWALDRRSGAFVPLAPSRLHQSTGTALAVSRGFDDGGNVLVQWAVKPSAPQFAAAIPGMPVRFTAGGSAVGLDPAFGLARALLTFLHIGDLPSARTLAEAVLSGAEPSDEAAAVAVGYYLLRSGDSRLRGFALRLAEAQPDSFDAQLIHASALMRDPDGWPLARQRLLAATQRGLPIFSQGLRLLDDALRLLIHGTEDPDLTAARQRYVPYLRVILNRPLTTFWGSDPAAPAPAPPPGRFRRPEHAVLMRLERFTPTLRPVRAPRTAPKRSDKAAMSLMSADYGSQFGPYTVRVIPTDPVALTGAPTGSLDLPDELAAELGGQAMGHVSRTGDQLIVLISNVVKADNSLQVIAQPNGSDSPSVALQRRGSALMAGLPWQETTMPDTIQLRGFFGRRTAGTEPAADPPQAELVQASAISRKATMVEEAERLSVVTIGWEDAAARLNEIAQAWPTLPRVDAATETTLWQRFESARQTFGRRHSPRTVIEPRLRPPPGRLQQPSKDSPQVTIGDDGSEEPLTIEAAELRMRSLLQGSNSADAAWEALAPAATAYCLSTVTAWLTAGHVPRPCRLDRRTAAELQRPWSRHDAAQLAIGVATNAVAHFRDRRLAGRLWRIEHGVTLVTELLDACAVALPPALRSAAGRRSRTSGDVPSPASGRSEIDPILRSAAVLRDARYSRAEVAELLGLPNEAAVTRAVGRYRRCLHREPPEGGRPDV